MFAALMFRVPGRWLAALAVFHSALFSSATLGDLLGPSSRRTSWVISEIMYHPSDTPGTGNLEFVEIHNSSLIAEDLAGYRLAGELNFVFPSNTVVAAGGFVVVAPSPAEVEAHYGISGVLGGSTDRLSNAGGQLQLINPAGAVLLDLEYSDDPPWPAAADGAGHSLVLNRPSYGEADPRAWAASAEPGGSPGFPEPTPSSAEPGATADGRSGAAPFASAAAEMSPSVVINEIMYHPISGDDRDEYIELHNATGTPMNLSGWRFTDGIEFEFPAGTSIAPGAYLVVAADASWLRSRFPQLTTANTLGDFSGSLANGGERIVLARPEVLGGGPGAPVTNYITVDEVTYADGGAWGRWSDGGGSSLELKDPRSDNSMASNWADSDESRKAEWTTIEATGVLDHGVGVIDQLQLVSLGAGEYLIDDVEVRRGGGANLVANGTFNSSASGWVSQGTLGGSRWDRDNGAGAPGSLRVIAEARGDTGANRIRTAVASGLSSGATATIRAKVRWLRGHPEFLLRLRGNYLEATGALHVPENPGTPCEANSRLVQNAPPAVDSLRHEPILPAGGEAVVISARVDDPDGVSSVLLRYRVDPSPTATEVMMVDDGTRGDAIPGDRVFTVTLPPQPAGTLVAFRIVATDAAAMPLSATWPEDYEALIRFGESQPVGTMGTYRIWMTRATFDRWTERSRLDNTPLPVTFVYNAERVVHGVGALYAGSPHIAPSYSTPTGNLCGYVLIFPDDEPFLGATEIVLDWPGRDPTAQQEQMAYWIARELGIPFNHRRFIHLHVNGVTSLSRGSVYEDAQQVNSDLIESWNPGGDGGDLFKIEQWFEFTDNVSRSSLVPPRLENYTTTGGQKKLARYRWNWLKRAVRDSANDYSELFELVDAANATEGYPGTLTRLINVEEWMRVFAVENIVVNFDAWGYDIGKNMYAYKPPGGPWSLYMWDIDWVMLASAQHGYSPQSPLMYLRELPSDDNRDPVVGRMYNDPELQRGYWRAIHDAINGPLRPERIAARMDPMYAALRANGVTHSAGQQLRGPSQVKTWLRDRRQYLIDQLTGASASFTLAPPPPVVTETNRVALRGTAPITVQRIAVNDVPVALSWQSLSNWIATISLQPGNNSLVIQGVDRLGNPIPGAAASVEIRFDGELPPATMPVINEWMASNQRAAADPADGQFDDWFELFNPGDDFVDLAGFSLTDNPTVPRKFVIPVGTRIPPRGFLLVWADEQVHQNKPGGDLHASFRLSQDGESISLFSPVGVLLDQVEFGPMATDISGGRWPDAGPLAVLPLSRPTPGAPNVSPIESGTSLRFLGITRQDATQLLLTWESEPGAVYRLETAEQLAPDAWSSVTPEIPAAGATTSISDSLPAGLSQRFYRIRRVR